MTADVPTDDATGRPTARWRSDRRVLAASLAWGGLCALAYALLSLRRFARLEPTSWDNAIFEQAVQGYARLGAPIVDIKGPGFNILGDHFSPVTALLAPVYRIWPAAQTLLVAQAVLIGLSVVVVTALAVRTVGRWPGGVLGAAYGLSFGIQSAVRSDFHEVAFGAPLLALAGAAFVERRWPAVAGWSLPLLLVKEDLGLTVAAVGVALWLAGARRRGLYLAALGVVWTAIVLVLVIPAFNPEGGYAYASSLGGDRGVVETLFTSLGTKLGTVALTVGVTGLAALWSPWVLVVLPTFAWRFAGDNAFYWGTDWHYSLLLMPVVFVAAVDAMRRRPVLRWAAVPAAVVTAVTLVGSPLSTLLERQTWEASPRAATAERIQATIPDGASVETDIGLITHLATDHRVYWIGTIDGVRPEWVVLDHDANVGSPQDALAYAQGKYGGTWRRVIDADGYEVVKRTS
ncbi:MAG: DUF2079 domain-containing protein [Aeromicrobium erythreum]